MLTGVQCMHRMHGINCIPCHSVPRSDGASKPRPSATVLNLHVEPKPGGVVFLMNSTSVEEAKSIVEALPLAANGYLVFDYIPVGPLQPLGLLIESPQAE